MICAIRRLLNWLRQLRQRFSVRLPRFAWQVKRLPKLQDT